MVVQRKTVIRLVEVIVVIGVLYFLFILFLITSGRVSPELRNRIICGTNLKSIGMAMTVYAEDSDGQFPQLPGAGPWSKKLGFAFDLAKPDFSKGGLHSAADRTITASLYLLVRECDISPKYFVCGGDKDITPFDGSNPARRDLFDLWDFGAEPHKHVSYAMHNPYGAYPSTAKRSASFAIAGDMSPWLLQGEFVRPITGNKDLKKNITLMPPYFSNVSNSDPSITRDQIFQSNVLAHQRNGQNVTFADGHSEYVKTSDVGVKHDNIYTYWSATEHPTESDIRIGTNPTARDKDNDAKSADDSFLAI